MKNRKVSSGHENISVRRLESEIVKSYTDLRTKRRSTANTFLQKSAQILQTYNQFFTRPQNPGDPNAFFKQSLRNYDPLDLKSLEFEANRGRKSSKFNLDEEEAAIFTQTPPHRERKPRSILTNTVRTPPSRSNLNKNKKKRELQLKQQRQEQQTFKSAEDDSAFKFEVANIYDTSLATSSQFKLKNNELNSGEEEEEEGEDEDKERFIMAEESGEEGFFGSTVKLVDQAEEELAQIEKENEGAEPAPGGGVEGEEEGGDEAGPESAPLSEPVTDTETDGETAPATDTETEGEAEGGGQEQEAPPPPPPLEQENVLDKLEEVVKEIAPAEVKTVAVAEEAEDFSGGGEDSVVKEVEECEKQCMDIYKTVDELKNRVKELLNKTDKSPEEELELAQKKVALNEKMLQMEQKTMKIEALLDQAKNSQKAQFNRRHSEDALPKVIICGLTESNVPNLIICDDKKKKKKQRSGGRNNGNDMPIVPPDMGVMPQFAKRLSDSYCMQEKLAKENADLEGKRFKLQEDLMSKDQTVENLQRKLCSLQCEYRMVIKENNLLQQRLHGNEAPCGRGDIGDLLNRNVGKMPCGRGRSPCPAEMEQRLQECTGTTQQLERQLGDIESDVRNLQNELVAVQKERMHLEQHRRMMQAAPTCPPPPSCGAPPCSAPCARPSSDQQLREMREKYNTLQDDYKSKLTEVAGLRADVELLKKNAQAAEDAKKSCLEKVLELEKQIKILKGTNKEFTKEMMMELEQQLNVAKQRYREAKDELEETKAMVEDQQGQLEEYRKKYLEAQQKVEEQRRQIDMMELESNRINEQVNLEIQRVKNQFQEKLQELTPLPDILKATQVKLQEAQQMHLLAERNNEALVRELQAYKDKAILMADQMEKVRSDQELGAGERATLQQKLAEWEAKCTQLMDENERLCTDITRLEMSGDECEKRVQEKAHEIAQLTAQVESVREESARQVTRTKDRCETVRRSMQLQISELEKQLAQSRAAARAAQKDRDEIRQKMQSQINNLNENFEDAQMRIKNLQGHINFLKNSYDNVFAPADLPIEKPVDCNCGTNY